MNARTSLSSFSSTRADLPGSAGISLIPIWSVNGVVAHALVDSDMEYTLNQHRWHLTRNGYVRRMQSGKYVVLMHRAILGLERADGRFVDHINHDKLDNRRANLRIGTRQQNNQNRLGVRGGKDVRVSHRGVARSGNRFLAYAYVSGKRRHAGCFATEIEAAVAAAALRKSLGFWSSDGNKDPAL